MTPASRRIVGVLALLLATQAFSACNTGMRLGAKDATVDAPPKPTAAAAAAAVETEAGESGSSSEAEEAPAQEAEEEAAAPAPNDCISSKCHTTILSKPNLHDAAEGCTDCHEEVSTPHPAKGAETFKLVQDMPDLCSTCHDEYGKKKTVHSPVGDGACTDCHDPHSTKEEKLLANSVGEVCKECHESQVDHPNLHGPVSDGDCIACHDPHETDTTALLKIEGNALCFSCHDGIKETVDTAEVPHAAMDDEAGCLLCHSPHSSDNPSLLVKTTREVCVECHDDVIQPNMTVFHGKGGSGNCADCHTPHGGALEGLLVAEHPEGKYQVYSNTAYPLCFSCHDRELVKSFETTDATGFRDGNKNLHSVHVDDGEKGRTCGLCHSVHGSSNPKLIKDNVAFGKWKLTLKFVKTETGGGCAPGCHKPQYYDRDRAGRKPASAAAARPASDFAP